MDVSTYMLSSTGVVMEPAEKATKFVGPFCDFPIEPAFECGWAYVEGRGVPSWDYRRGDASQMLAFEVDE